MSFKLPRITRSISNITEVTAYMHEVAELRQAIKNTSTSNPDYQQLYRNYNVAEKVLERLLEKAEH